MTTFTEALAAAFDAYNAGRFDAAESACRTLHPLAPRDGQLCFLLGMALHKLGRADDSIFWLGRAAELQPDSAAVFNGLGCAHAAKGDMQRAADSFGESIRLNPEHPDPYYGRANACHRLGQLELAAGLFKTAVDLNPQDHDCWNNLGKTLRDLNRLDEAIEAYDRSLRILPGSAIVNRNRAIALLAAGRLREGFNDYEWRWCVDNRGAPSRTCPQPMWNGESIADGTLLVRAEQGLGDTIQFVRYVRLVRERVARVIVECQPPLKRLLQNSGCAESVVAVGETLPPFDHYISVMSLARVFQTTLETIPAQTPYLVGPTIRQMPQVSEGHLKVGLVWAGDPKHPGDADRSICLEEFRPVLQTPGITFFSLQLDVPSRDEPVFKTSPNIVKLTPRPDDLFDTAGLINRLDRVICVDTSVAHLAGALGCPTWALIPRCPDWRWLLDRSDTPWYPTMRLFRQRERGNWREVMNRVAEELRMGSAGSPPRLIERTIPRLAVSPQSSG